MSETIDSSGIHWLTRLFVEDTREKAIGIKTVQEIVQDFESNRYYAWTLNMKTSEIERKPIKGYWCIPQTEESVHVWSTVLGNIDCTKSCSLISAVSCLHYEKLESLKSIARVIVVNKLMLEAKTKFSCTSYSNYPNLGVEVIDSIVDTDKNSVLGNFYHLYIQDNENVMTDRGLFIGMPSSIEESNNSFKRISKDNYYLDLADTVSKRGTCLRRRYGAVIVKNDEVISTGYVGAPRGRKNCSDLGHCLREDKNIPRGERYELCRSVHAEANAIISAPREKMIGSTMYLVGRELSTGNYVDNPNSCSMCKRLIINAGIEKVVIRETDKTYKVILVSDWITNDESLEGILGY